MRISGVVAFATTFLAAVPSFAAGPFDGVYKGATSVGGGGRCPPGAGFEIQVRDSEFNWRSASDVTRVRIMPDGSFTGQLGTRYLNGRVAGSAMTAATTGAACNYSWSLTK